MPSRKGKGRQSLGFGRKSQRAAFQQEWQQRLQEDYYVQVHKYERPRKSPAAAERRTFSCTNSLRRLIAERQFWDRVQDDEQQVLQRQKAAPSQRLSPGSPGWIIYHHPADSDDDFAHEFLQVSNATCTSTSTSTSTSTKLPTLQSLALTQLAKSLPAYLEALGVEQLHRYLSLLPGQALTVLSVQLSLAGTMTNDLCQVLARHSQLQRFSLCAKQQCDDCNDSLQPNEALKRLLPFQEGTAIHTDTADEKRFFIHNTNSKLHVPDSWEELLNDDDDDDEEEEEPPFSLPFTPSPRSLCSLERLQLGNLPFLDLHLLKQVLLTCAPRLTHLGLIKTLTYGGPDVLRNLSQWVPLLQVLDVSGNTSWVTQPLLKAVYESFIALWISKDGHHDNRNGNDRLVQDQDPLDEQDFNDDDAHHHHAKLLGVNPTQSRQSASSSSAAAAAAAAALPIFKQSSCSQHRPQPQPQPRSQHNHNLQQQQRQQPRLLIKATGCLSRSSQLLMEMEFGTLF
jgi:hypothetical protein